jgi:hypothetical protein
VVGNESVPALATGNKSAAPAWTVNEVAELEIVLASVERALLENCCGMAVPYKDGVIIAYKFLPSIAG